MIALYPMTGKQLKAGAFVAGTIGLAEELGRLVRETRAAHGDPVGAVVERLNARRLFAGKVVDVARRTEAGWAKAEVQIDGSGDDAGSSLVLQTRTSTWSRSGTARSCARCPTSSSSWTPRTAARSRPRSCATGSASIVIGAPCVPDWRTEAGLALVGPRYFGYDIDFVPVEERFPN